MKKAFMFDIVVYYKDGTHEEILIEFTEDGRRIVPMAALRTDVEFTEHEAAGLAYLEAVITAKDRGKEIQEVRLRPIPEEE